MKLGEKIKVILQESLSSPGKNSFVTVVDGHRVILREGGVYKNVKLRGADLRGAHLDKINLEGADLTDALLTGATLRKAKLRGAKFKGAVVSGTDFTGAEVESTSLDQAVAAFSPVGIKYEVKG